MLYAIAKHIRNNKILKYIPDPCYSHLDIGSGDGYLLSRSPARHKTSIPADAEFHLPQLQDYYTIITMVAVFEHLTDPAMVMRECCRLLYGGQNSRIIITSPTWLGHLLTPLVSYHDFKEHKHVINYQYLRAIVPPEYKIIRKGFELMLNQLYIIESDMVKQHHKQPINLSNYCPV